MNFEELEKLQKQIEQEWEQAKEQSEGEDYSFYELGIKYEIKEWVCYSIMEGERNSTLKYLATKQNPLQFVFDLWLKYDDELWNKFDDMVSYDERWYKAHKEVSNE